MNKPLKVPCRIFLKICAIILLVQCSTNQPADTINATGTTLNFPFTHTIEIAFLPNDTTTQTGYVKSAKQSTAGGLFLLVRGSGYHLYYLDEEGSGVLNSWNLSDSSEILDYEVDSTRNLFVLARQYDGEHKITLQSFDSTSSLRWTAACDSGVGLFSSGGIVKLLTQNPSGNKWILRQLDSESGNYGTAFQVVPGSPPFLPFSNNVIYARRGPKPDDGCFLYNLISGDTSTLTLAGQTLMVDAGIDSSGTSIGIFVYSNGFTVNSYNDQTGKGWQTQIKSIIPASDREIFVDAGEYAEDNSMFKKVIVYNNDSIDRILGLRINESIDINSYDFVLEECTTTELIVVGYAVNGDKDLVMFYDQKGNFIRTHETENFFAFNSRLPAYAVWKYIGGRLIVPVQTPEGIHVFSFTE